MHRAPGIMGPHIRGRWGAPLWFPVGLPGDVQRRRQNRADGLELEGTMRPPEALSGSRHSSLT